MYLAMVNCNTDGELTAALGRIGASVARPGTEVVAASPSWGVPAAEGFFDSYVSAASVLDLLVSWDGPLDGVVMAGFGEHGRDGVRQLLDVPVVDITEAAALSACLVGAEFGVVTSVDTAISQIRQSLLLLGLDRRCRAVRATGLDVAALYTQPEKAVRTVLATSRDLLNEGADVIVLGCAAMSPLYETVAGQLPVPVIDGVRVAVSLCEDLAHHGLSTSKFGPYRAANPVRVAPCPVRRSQPVQRGRLSV